VFSGTIKRNLDPFEAHSEAELLKVLDDVGLRKMIEILPEGINY